MEENKIILYKDEEGKVNVNVRIAEKEIEALPIKMCG